MKLDPFAIIFLVIQLIFFVVYAAVGNTGGVTASTDGTAGLISALLLVFQYGYVRDALLLTFLGFGLWLGMIRRYGISGLAITFVVGAISIQFGIMMISFFVKADSEDLGSNVLYIDLATLIEGNYAALAVIVSLGALLGTVSPGQMLIIALVEVLFYSLNWYLCTIKLQAIDPGRSMIVHVFGATFGLVAGVLTPSEFKKDAQELHSDLGDMLGLLGTIVIWVLFPSYIIVATASSLALLNAFIAVLVSVVTTFLLSRLLIADDSSRKFNISQIQTGTIAGAVAVGTVVDRGFGPGGAALMAILGVTLSVCFSRFVTPKISGIRFHQDTRGVLHTSLLPGALSGIASVIITLMVNKEVFNNDTGSGFPKGDDQPGFQLAALIVCLISGIVGGAAVAAGLHFGRGIGFLNGEETDKYEDSSYFVHAEGETAATPTQGTKTEGEPV